MYDATVSVDKTQQLQIKLWVSNNSTSTIRNVYVDEDLSNGLKIDYGTKSLSPGASVAATNGETMFTYTIGDITGKLQLGFLLNLHF